MCGGWPSSPAMSPRASTQSVSRAKRNYSRYSERPSVPTRASVLRNLRHNVSGSAISDGPMIRRSRLMTCSPTLVFDSSPSSDRRRDDGALLRIRRSQSKRTSLRGRSEQWQYARAAIREDGQRPLGEWLLDRARVLAGWQHRRCVAEAATLDEGGKERHAE